MPDMKGITVKIPADLHAELKAYIEAHGMTTGEFIAQAVDHELHPKIQITQEDKNMERMRTLAFQVPDSLFQRVKAYLERNHMSQKQFVIGLIESEIEQDEAQYQAEHPEEQEDEEETDGQAQDEETEEETQDEFAHQEAQEGPDAGLEEQPAAQEDTAPVADFEAGSEDVSQEDDGAEEAQEEEAQEVEKVFEGSGEAEEFDGIEDVEDSRLVEVQKDSLEGEESQEDEEAWEESADQEETQDEEEEQDYQPGMAW